MNRHIGCLLLGALSILPVAHSGGADRARPDSIDGAAAFERLKSLVGTWEGSSARDGAARVTYELVSGGSVLVERFSAESLPGGGAMLTTYYPDGADLMLTHYCLAKNQPRMRAERVDPVHGEVEFVFTGVDEPVGSRGRPAATSLY